MFNNGFTLKRLFYFGFGFTIGLFILFFFLGGKRASCDYGPNARTLKNIRSKKIIVENEVYNLLKYNDLDTTKIQELLKEGNVIFSESNTQVDSCKIYTIKGPLNNKDVKIKVENCSKTATILSICCFN